MNIFDIVIVILLAYSLFRGISKGFVIEISGMIALFLGIMGAFKFSSFVLHRDSEGEPPDLAWNNGNEDFSDILDGM